MPSICSINVGEAAPFNYDGLRFRSAIIKKPIARPTIQVGRLGLSGDEQVNLSVHGGVTKAVYAFPSEHYSYWREQHTTSSVVAELPYGSLGENLTIKGLLEPDVFLGDRWHFNQVVLTVTEPRQPCRKFNAVIGDLLAGKKMLQKHHCGCYLSVSTGGEIAWGESFQVEPGPRLISVAKALGK